MRTTTTIASLFLFAVAAAAAAPAAAAIDPLPPVYEPGSHYTATFHQRDGLWRLQPADGRNHTVAVDRDCAAATEVPHGVWLLAHVDGQLVLRAPSTTPLPTGHPGEVPLRSCDEGAVDGVRAPSILLDVLAEHTGAVYVSE